MYSVFPLYVYMPPPATQKTSNTNKCGGSTQSQGQSGSSCGGCVWVVHWAGLPRSPLYWAWYCCIG